MLREVVGGCGDHGGVGRPARHCGVDAAGCAGQRVGGALILRGRTRLRPQAPPSGSTSSKSGTGSPDNAVLDTVALPPGRNLVPTFDRVFRMAYGFIRQQAGAGQAPDSTMMRAMLAAEWDEARAATAGVLPEYADLQCTAPGTIWIQPFDPDAGQMGRGPGWLRITPDGSTASFRFPDTFRPLRFDSARALGIWRGEFDIESVAWMRLPGQ